MLNHVARTFSLSSSHPFLLITSDGESWLVARISLDRERADHKLLVVRRQEDLAKIESHCFIFIWIFYLLALYHKWYQFSLYGACFPLK